jgi:hypothetical protein
MAALFSLAVSICAPTHFATTWPAAGQKFGHQHFAILMLMPEASDGVRAILRQRFITAMPPLAFNAFGLSPFFTY